MFRGSEDDFLYVRDCWKSPEGEKGKPGNYEHDDFERAALPVGSIDADAFISLISRTVEGA